MTEVGFAVAPALVGWKKLTDEQAPIVAAAAREAGLDPTLPSVQDRLLLAPDGTVCAIVWSVEDVPEMYLRNGSTGSNWSGYLRLNATAMPVTEAAEVIKDPAGPEREIERRRAVVEEEQARARAAAAEFEARQQREIRSVTEQRRRYREYDGEAFENQVPPWAAGLFEVARRLSEEDPHSALARVLREVAHAGWENAKLLRSRDVGPPFAGKEWKGSPAVSNPLSVPPRQPDQVAT